MSTLFYHKLLRVKHIVTIRLFEGRDDQRSLSRRRWKRNTGTEIAGREGAHVPASRLTQQIDLDRLLVRVVLGRGWGCVGGHRRPLDVGSLPTHHSCPAFEI